MLDGSILQKLAIAHNESTPESTESSHSASQTALNYGVYYKNTLVALCHALEDAILASKGAPLMLAAFQRGKWYLEEAERYGQIAERARHIVILAAPEAGFAEHPTSQQDNVALVKLDEQDPVAQEWHLIILSPTYTAMVLCQELSPADYGPEGSPASDQERKFYGFWTFEPGLVQEAATLLIEHIGRYNPDLQHWLSEQVAIVTREYQTAQHDDLGEIAARVVDYLQLSQQKLGQLQVWAHSAPLEQNLVSSELQALLRMAQLVDLTDPSAPMAASEVTVLAEMLGQLLDLPAWQLKRLRLAGLLHRIVPAQLVREMPVKGKTAEEINASVGGPCCTLTSEMQALRRMPRLQAVARIIMHQSEWWNGSGQPGGFGGNDIPVESQILGLMAEFQKRVTQYQNVQPQIEVSLERAWEDCQAERGDRWNPELLDRLQLLVKGLQQGLLGSVPLPRTTAGLSFLSQELIQNATPVLGVNANG